MQVNFRKIDQALDDIENYASYYVGATLCIDFKYHPNVALNLNGRGFSYLTGTKLETNNIHTEKGQTFLVTNEMQKKIRKIYYTYKGGKNDRRK